MMEAVARSRRIMLVKNAKSDTNLYLKGKRKKTIHLDRLENFDKKVSASLENAKNFHLAKNKMSHSLFRGDLKRKSAFFRLSISSFSGLNHLSKKPKYDFINSLIDEEMGKRITGNKCESSIKGLESPGIVSPYDFKQKGDVRRPPILIEAIDRLLFASLYPVEFNTLFFHSVTKKSKRWGKKKRLMRIEGRISMVQVLAHLLLVTDIKSLRSGVYNPVNKQFWGLSRKKLAKKTGLPLSRVKTALHNLVSLGILHKSKQRREKEENGDFKGLPVVRVFTTKLFIALGLGTRLKEQRNPEIRALLEKEREKKREDQRLKDERDRAEAKVNKEIDMMRRGSSPRMVKRDPDEWVAPNNVMALLTGREIEPDYS